MKKMKNILQEILAFIGICLLYPCVIVLGAICAVFIAIYMVTIFPINMVIDIYRERHNDEI